MSSNAVPVLRFSPAMLAIALLCAMPAPVSAQDDSDVASDAEEAEAVAPRRQFEGIDLSVTVPKDPSDKLLEQDCEEEADAGRIAGEIVVCRELGEATDGSWNKADWERRYAEKTKGGSTPNTFGIPNHGNPIGFGRVPPPAVFIDVEALPQAPAGSDADRIARGLPPLGEDPDPTPEEIAERRRALGLPAPPVSSEPE
ncbi:hypothetical protein [Erythrobacter sp. THAF29]|uniref:hypothetical protein n=1 Tax=Erythrobacter sp. THAF29 TaxID=2587851 RepID=UPI001268069F|nr:hypothetical protein [Erythrobacter sp. THAF29]QFT76185.1 hypothetical protein FIU90_01385 [Erythrobacter sp. THAF29]